ncbi:hypothetical protein BOTNAR_0198g00160 [Botryotinia narcissicola]|uniref:Uncharacterized protein n=1 Tax=Botryotinia narcissicola TaxID=278944 RepID=A0A4Z1I7M4_9HELO|nr:hypothetical protein BOTNAR_0198g00160 [Botryotinia narcissicola]
MRTSGYLHYESSQKCLLVPYEGFFLCAEISEQFRNKRVLRDIKRAPLTFIFFSQPDFNIKQDIEPTRTISNIETKKTINLSPQKIFKPATAITKNFIINFIICFLASIAIADTHNVPLVEGIKLFELLPSEAPIDLDKSGIIFRRVWSPFRWKLVLFCESDNLSNDINCYWNAYPTNSPISTQPIREDLVFELESEAKFRQIDLGPFYESLKFDIIEVGPLILSADDAEYFGMAEKRGFPSVSFSGEVNFVREYGQESVLWCERSVHNSKGSS